MTPLCVLVPEVGVGSETFIRWDVHELLPGGTVVVADPPPGGASVRGTPAWTADGVPTLAFDALPGDPPPSAARRERLRRFLSEHDVEVVLVEYLDFADRWLGELARADRPVWLRGHGVDISARLREARWRAAYRRYADDVAGVIVPSHVAAEAVEGTGFPAAKIHVVGYAVEVPPAAEGRRPAGRVGCAMVGRLVAKKAPLLALDAWRLAAAGPPGLTLDVVGDGPMMDDVAAFVRAHALGGLVDLHGQRPHGETLSIIRRADILIHHAVTAPEDGDSEGQPLVILEAMAAGAAVVSTRHSGIPELIEDGVNGRLVDPGDVLAMAEAVQDLAGDPGQRRRLGRAALETVRSRHTVSDVRSRILDLLGLGDRSNAAETRSV